jgi:HK97 family phage portal protein
MAKSDDKVIKASIRALDEEYIPTATSQGIAKDLFTNEKNVSVDTLYNVLKQSPEVTACIEAIVEDIMADEWKYIGSKSAIEKTKKFVLASNFYKILSNAIYDLLITGNAYILKLSVKEDQIKEILTQLDKSLAKEFGIQMKKEEVMLLTQELTKSIKDLQLIKSSTVKINYDKTGKVLSYQQNVKGETRAYLPKDVIHLSLINIGGEPYGFTPLEPLLSDIATLLFAKDYVGRYFENDGVPNFLFLMPEDNPDSRNYELLKTELKELKKKGDKFRNLALTGKIDVQQLQKFNKDMEFAKLIEHFTQVVLIGMGVPTYRINYTISNQQQGSQVNRAYEGYYKKIGFIQNLLEHQLNKELFSNFLVEMVFNRAYKIDEMREAQIIQILTQVGAITIEEARDMMGMDPEKPKGTEPTKTGDQNNINFAEQKKTDEGQDNNPKQPDAQLDNKIKSINEEVDVSWGTFQLIVEKFVGEGNFDTAKIIYRETDEYFTLFFNDGSWKYRCLIDKTTLDVNKFRIEYLSRAVRMKS